MHTAHNTQIPNKQAYVTHNIQQWKQKPLHGRYPHEISDASIDRAATNAWLTNTNIFAESEGFMLAIQDQVIHTRNYRKQILKNTMATDVSRHCGRGSESIQHITSSCTKLANTDYKHRHDQVAKIIHQKLATQHKLITENTPYYKYIPQTILENTTHKLYWDRSILTDKTIHHNRPDITLFDKLHDTIYLIDIAVPNTHNIQKTITEKHRKYTELAMELVALTRAKRVFTVPVVLSSIGVIPNTLHNSINILNLHKNTYIQLQKAVIINTCHIVRKFLNTTQDNTFASQPSQQISPNNESPLPTQNTQQSFTQTDSSTRDTRDIETQRTETRHTSISETSTPDETDTTQTRTKRTRYNLRHL